MLAAAVEHFGAEELRNETVYELRRFLGQYSDILSDEEARNRVEMVIGPVEEWVLESLVLLFKV
jgi:hypothetical protein